MISHMVIFQNGSPLTRAQDTQDVSDCAHDDTGVLELSRNDTSDEQTDNLERSSSTVEKSSVEGGEAKTLDDGAGEVGQDTVGN